jgi:hypothetical protein
MKKLILSFVLFTSLIGASFAENFFAHIFFEIKLDVPVEVSNNLLGLTDIFQKDVVIDLAEIADNVKDKGAAIKGNIAPSVSIGIDIPRGLILGVKVGAEADIGVGLSDDLFEFFGKGNIGMGNKYKMQTQNTYADIFATVSVNGGWNTKKSRLEITGTAFSSIAHLDASDTYAALYINEDENSFEYKANVDAKLYTNMNFNNGFDDIDAILSAVKNNMGFDVTAAYQRDLFRFLTVGATARIPLSPSKLSMCQAVQTDYSGKFSIDDMLGKEDGEGDSGEVSEVQNPDEETGDNSFDMNNMLGEPVLLATPYAIHRPMKIGINANFHPFGTLLSTKGYLGIGIRHPFASAINDGISSDTDYYIDYSVAGRLSLWNIISLELSHEHMDEVYRNALSLAFNIRLAEVDAGVSMQSTNFTKSFTGAGIGAFVTVCVGF